MAKTIIDSLHLLCNLTCFITFNNKAFFWMKLTHLLQIPHVSFLLLFTLCLRSSISGFFYMRSSEITDKKSDSYENGEEFNFI